MTLSNPIIIGVLVALIGWANKTLIAFIVRRKALSEALVVERGYSVVAVAP